MATLSYTYNVHNKVGFETELAKIVKRYGADVVVSWGTPYTYKADFQVGYDRVIKVELTKHPVTVDFDFAEYKVEGFTYLGCIQDEMMMGLITVHGNDLVDDTTGTEIVDFVKQFEDIPCHNCGRNHRRKYGHVFRVNETGELVVFGSACAKNYFGIDFDRLLRFFEGIKIFTTGEWEEDYIREMRANTIEWKFAATLAYYQIKNFGYLSGTKAREQERSSSADMVREMYNDDTEQYYTKEVKREIQKMREAGELPNFDIMTEKDYVGKTEGLNDFEYNLMILQEKMKINMVTRKQFGWVTYLVYKEFFHVEAPKQEKKEYIFPEWAQVGRRIKKGEMEAQCTVTHKHAFDGFYGMTIIYTLEWDNVRFKWFATTDQHVEIGDEVVINGFTVKKIEDDPKYGKAIIINRARLEDPKSGKPTNGRERVYTPRVSQTETRLGMN